MLAVQGTVGAAITALVGIVGMLDFDHIGAEHGELISRERAGQYMGDVDDANALERSGHAGLLGRINRKTGKLSSSRAPGRRAK